MKRAASISECGRYRWALLRDWSTHEQAAADQRGFVLWVMLNPSTADGLVDDPTIRKCIGFSTRWGYSRLVACNLFALRATDPREVVLAKRTAIGTRTDVTMQRYAMRASMIVAAWGAHRATMLPGRVWMVRELLGAFGSLHCVGRCKHGDPMHPLMAPYTDAPEIWEPRNGYKRLDGIEPRPAIDWNSIECSTSCCPGIAHPIVSA